MTEWYRSTLSGERGRLVDVDGTQMIQVDQPGNPPPRRFDPRHWLLEAPRKPFMRGMLGKIAFVADKELALALGEVREHDKHWDFMTDQQRQRFLHEGPRGKHPLREELFAVIMECLKDSAE